MLTNQAVAVSDVSYQNDSGTAAWIIEGSMGANQIQGSMITPGTTGNHSSFQSEVAGIYGILLTPFALYNNIANTMGRIKIICDGKLVLECIKSKKTPRSICRSCGPAWHMPQFGKRATMENQLPTYQRTSG